MIILAGYGEDYAYFVPDIGDIIYDLVWHLDHYEYVKRIVSELPTTFRWWASVK